MEHVDVAIVGGGPAGSSAAAAAANEGADAVVFEKGVPRSDREHLGPDSTDAAGFLDYWVEVADIDYTEIPDDVILQELECAEFIGPSERVVLRDTNLPSSYPEFGFTFHRARFDDWLRERAEEAGADYRVGTGVRTVETELAAGHTHYLTLNDGTEVEADYLVLADGPQRQQTIPTLDQFVPEGRSVSEVLSPPEANHIAYQEYRRFPEDAFEPGNIKFWWGWMPGETAYPWVFPNDGNVARVGLTMPIGMDIDQVDGREDYRLLSPDDDEVPQGGVYIRRLLDEAYPEYDLEDFPLVESRGKSGGTETYPISSTKPIDSPTRAGIAVAGGAMGTTSAFHEGGDHVAMRTGKLAGKLAATDRLEAYNDAWTDAIDAEILRNIAMAEVVEDFGPADWDRSFRAVNRVLSLDASATPTPNQILKWARAAGFQGFKIAAAYRWQKRRYRNGKYVQFREDEYVYS
ncbi:NAD(P)/FAD-dependent oxidoreductase [Halobacteriales archaeon QS_1_68_20]|nr:MAG: NAD(P)/FAD-dependent oxidoreductase [Halobacteriales archaeon QS_1_68_20]